MKKIFATLFLFTATALVIAPNVLAGGSNVMLDPLNTGVANEKGVEVMVTVFDPYKNKLDWNGLRKYAASPTEYEPIGVMDLQVELKFQDPAEGRNCVASDGGKTNQYGQTKATCYSDTDGTYLIETNFTSDKPLYDGGRSAKGFIALAKITFEPGQVMEQTSGEEVSPVIIDQDESETKEQLEQIQAENEAQKQQIEELMESVKEQQEEVSALKAIIMKLQAFFDSLFG